MGEKTGIAWCDHSWNPWIGCTEVSPGCDNCYARVMDARKRWDGGRTHWGAGVPRYRTAASNWKQPLSWDNKAFVAGERRTVFPSLCDPFDNEVPDELRLDLFDLIDATPNLTWLLLTKRIGNAAKMLPRIADAPSYKIKAVPNVWLGASVVNQEEADRDIPKLLATPAAKRFVSYEPALGPVDFRFWLKRPYQIDNAVHPSLDWLIVGGESAQGGAKARPFDLAWARSTVAQCKAAGVPAFVKQIGSNPRQWLACGPHDPFRTKDSAGANPTEWPADLKVQEIPA